MPAGHPSSSMARSKTHKTGVPTPSRSKLKKDPGIPQLPSLKQKHAVKQNVHSVGPAPPEDALMASEPTLSSLAVAAAAESAAAEASCSSSDASSSNLAAINKRQYLRTLHKVIDDSDIVLFVLDARDPEGCRSRLIEEEVRRREAEGKRLVFVVNKIDLVPRENAEAWLRHLRHTAPTLPFRSSTQQQRANLSSRTAPALLSLLKSLRPSNRSVTVGVVGYPNVGKSSLINSLRRAKVCAVASEPGWTKTIQSVAVERGIKVLDSPGVVFDDEESETANLLLRNVLRVDEIPDPIAVVEQILLRTEQETLRRIYPLPEFDNPVNFLTMHALSTGRLLKGGTPDLLSSARAVIADWNAHKIPFFTQPPLHHPSTMPQEGAIVPGAENVGEAQIVTSFAPAFDMGNLFGQANGMAFDDAPSNDTMDEDIDPVTHEDMQTEVQPLEGSRKRARSLSPDFDADELDRADTSFATAPGALESSKRSSRPPTKRVRRQMDAEYTVEPHNPLSRKLLRREAKKARKVAQRNVGSGGSMLIDDNSTPFDFTMQIPALSAAT